MQPYPPPYYQSPYYQPPSYPPPRPFMRWDNPVILALGVLAIVMVLCVALTGISAALSSVSAISRTASNAVAEPPNGYLLTAPTADAPTEILFLQFGDDGIKTHTLDGTLDVAWQTDTGMQNTSYTVSGSRDGDRISLRIQGTWGAAVTWFGTFGALQHTLTLRGTNSSTGCAFTYQMIAASAQDYNNALDKLRVTPVSDPTGPQGETCQQ